MLLLLFKLLLLPLLPCCEFSLLFFLFSMILLTLLFRGRLWLILVQRQVFHCCCSNFNRLLGIVGEPLLTRVVPKPLSRGVQGQLRLGGCNTLITLLRLTVLVLRVLLILLLITLLAFLSLVLTFLGLVALLIVHIVELLLLITLLELICSLLVLVITPSS